MTPTTEPEPLVCCGRRSPRGRRGAGRASGHLAAPTSGRPSNGIAVEVRRTRPRSSRSSAVGPGSSARSAPTTPATACSPHSRASGVEHVGPRGGVTGTVVVVVEPDGERTMFSDRGSAAQFTEAERCTGSTTRRVVHVPYYAIADAPDGGGAPVARRRTRPRMIVSMDPSDVGARRGRFATLVRGDRTRHRVLQRRRSEGDRDGRRRAPRCAPRRREAGRANRRCCEARCTSWSRCRRCAAIDRHDRCGRRIRGWIPPRLRARAPPVAAVAAGRPRRRASSRGLGADGG